MRDWGGGGGHLRRYYLCSMMCSSISSSMRSSGYMHSVHLHMSWDLVEGFTTIIANLVPPSHPNRTYNKKKHPRNHTKKQWIFTVCAPPLLRLVGAYYLHPPDARTIFYMMIYYVMARAL